MRAYFLTFLTIVVIGSITTARSESLIEKFVSPGDLVAKHAKFEATCNSCHAPFAKGSQKQLCLDCHKDVASDIASRKGFHGKKPDVGGSECKLCHSDHKGRTATIVDLDIKTFDHRLTDYELRGAHGTAKCGGCHKENTKYRSAPITCIACHAGKDVHKGGLGTDCAACHAEDSWAKPKRFDHSKTNFPLVGAHQKPKCAACHVGEKYKGLGTTCISCHRKDDTHKGRFGDKCETCHNAMAWSSVTFDHNKSTKFALNGAHRTTKCTGCHTGNLYGVKIATTCVACHKANDPHKGQLGPQCESCHNESSWKKNVEFDHELSRFPLLGRHQNVPCASCHKSRAYRDVEKSCSGCHADTHHQQRLGPNCQNCHNAFAWTRWKFDHQRTNFPLTGAHVGLKCESCHNKPTGSVVTAPTSCFGCHQSDDTHRGTFGRECAKCHNTTSFRTGFSR